jgi:hypothetical protein
MKMKMMSGQRHKRSHETNMHYQDCDDMTTGSQMMIEHSLEKGSSNMKSSKKLSKKFSNQEEKPLLLDHKEQYSEDT